MLKCKPKKKERQWQTMGCDISNSMSNKLKQEYIISKLKGIMGTADNNIKNWNKLFSKLNQ